jgi:hypothetical protein
MIHPVLVHGVGVPLEMDAALGIGISFIWGCFISCKGAYVLLCDSPQH